MRERKDARNNESAIQCIEVLISRSHLPNSSHNIFWTLSVYSLENQPVKKDRPLRNSEIFHFMTFDWNRTIKKLLDDHNVPYAVIQSFFAANICSDVTDGSLPPVDNEAALLSAVTRLSKQSRSTGSGLAAGLPEQEDDETLQENEKSLMGNERLR